MHSDILSLHWFQSPKNPKIPLHTRDSTRDSHYSNYSNSQVSPNIYVFHLLCYSINFVIFQQQDIYSSNYSSDRKIMGKKIDMISQRIFFDWETFHRFAKFEYHFEIWLCHTKSVKFRLKGSCEICKIQIVKFQFHNIFN